MIADAAARDALARAALALAAEGGWRKVSVPDLAAAANVPVADLLYATPGEAVDCVESLMDRTLAAGLIRVDTESSVRDRLFDLAMRRFEAMEPHRAAFLAFEAAQSGDPVLLASAHHRAVRTARWILALAGLECDGVTGAARAQGLAVILTQARTAWRAETDTDFVKTMAALDKALRRAEETFGRFAGFETPAKSNPAPA